MQQFKSEHVVALLVAIVLAYFLTQKFASKKEGCCGMNPQGPMY